MKCTAKKGNNKKIINQMKKGKGHEAALQPKDSRTPCLSLISLATRQSSHLPSEATKQSALDAFQPTQVVEPVEKKQKKKEPTKQKLQKLCCFEDCFVCIQK